MSEQVAVSHAVFELDRLLTHWNVLLVVAVWALIQSVRRTAPAHWFAKRAPLGRLLPLLPLLLCGAAVWIPGPWFKGDESVGEKVVLGIVLGALTANFAGIASRFGIAKVLRLDGGTAAPSEPEEEQTEKVKKAPQ